MSNKTKSKRPQKKKHNRASNNSIGISGDVKGSKIISGNNNTIIDSQSPTDNLVPMVLESESPIPSSLDFYLKAPLAKLGGIFRDRHDAARVLFAFFAAVLIYAGGIFAFRIIQQTPLPPSLADLFLYIAPGEHFYYYYPDWNAVAFDFILNPLTVVSSIFFHQTIFDQQSGLIRIGALKVGDVWNRRLTSRVWVWCATAIPFLLGVAAIMLSWVSRYQFYVTDLYALRYYVLGLIGISTFLRNSMLISLLHASILLSVSASNLPLDILNPAAKRRYERFGDSCMLINFSGLLIFLYALTTIYTSIVKRIMLKNDYLFWEAVIHLIAVLLILLYFNYQQILVARHVQELKDDYEESKLKTEGDAARHQAVSILLSGTPNHPIWISIRKHWLMMLSITLMTLLPVTLFAIGSNPP